jgi:hypothetical protein
MFSKYKPTIGVLRQTDGFLKGFLISNLSYSSQTYAATAHNTVSTWNNLGIIEPNFQLVPSTSLNVMNNTVYIRSTKPKEGFALLRIGTKVNNEFAVNEKVATARDG